MRLPASVRRITDPLFANVRVPIFGGVNRGLWWSLASSGSGYASGRRAASQMQLIENLIHPGDVVLDVGAHHGYVTLAASRKVGATGSVHAFEPSKANRGRLIRHVAWNALSNVSVHPFALSNYDGESTFGGTGTSKMFSMGAGSEVVQVRSAESLVRQRNFGAPDFVKIDVEGAEADALRGLMPVLSSSTRLFIAMHNADVDRQCTDMLQGAGFTCVASRALESSRMGPWSSDPDLFCFGPEYQRQAKDLATLRATDF
jgi:FkbM family methyltransferase